MTGRIFVDMIPLWFDMAICFQRQFTAECNQQKCDTLPFVQIVISAVTSEKADLGRTKVMVNPLSEGRERYLFCLWDFIQISLDFRQLRGKTNALLG